MSRFSGYIRLMRVDKPIGIYLLLWPTYWALWLAEMGTPHWSLLIIFTAGVFLMRAAGCVINDYADRHIDGQVRRTAQRPIVAGEVMSRQALILFFVLIALSFALVLLLNWQTILLSVGALFLAACYPFMKRYTHLPQVVLGAAFSWAIPMAFMATSEGLPWWSWILYLANLLWIVAYDTQYAMVDREDDLLIGVKSTAILFGRYDRLIIALMQMLSVSLLVWLGMLLSLGAAYYLACAGCAMLVGYQQYLIADRDREKCFRAFLNNHYFGLLLTLGLIGSLSF
ncbi:4-hydroxybenzoate octaprenyltransferase [Lacimicrobium alkaliphilum]|uniref:4-hydroxybenzoate octaprenyltransferase n=1 Tax=Lacimicrobium alkaliphilum TaxID=1526571 RepID=A0ABQ1RT22_9ALTE|nr:4-hydroxybenzoate octaprenyltransferase [Lacimicrobium alkaliphilum]GGD77227.1 4-hydroxybenzoate octaprenyltransferase [Lacimicrobium alkaliphilum]